MPAGIRFCVLCCCVEAFDTLDVVFFFFIINDGLAGLSVIPVLFCVATIYTLGAAFSGPASGHVWHGEASRRIHGEN